LKGTRTQRVNVVQSGWKASRQCGAKDTTMIPMNLSTCRADATNAVSSDKDTQVRVSFLLIARVFGSFLN
jgi:hypothetical protein